MGTCWTHQQLVQKAVKWLQKPLGKGGTACHVAVSEFPTGWKGEIPDAIGFRVHSEALGGSVVCEVKVSRSDFLADAKKAHRSGEVMGVGEHRFYVAPEGLIRPEELPKKWGLVEISSRGAASCVVGYPMTTHIDNRQTMFDHTRFDVDTQREMNVLIRLLSRIGDAEELNEIKRANRRLSRQVELLTKQVDEFETATYLKELNDIRASHIPVKRQLQRAKNRLGRS